MSIIWDDTPVKADRIDWSKVKDQTDLAAVATNLLGPARERKGQRLLWPCPFHDDHDPSFQVDLTRKTWRCWTCALSGDAAELVKRIHKCDFPTAVRFLAGLAGVIPSPQGKPVWPAQHSTAAKAPQRPPEGPSGLPLNEASSLVEKSVRCLWGPGGKIALAYLHGRGLTEATIRAAGLGLTPKIWIPKRDGTGSYPYWGIIIPWKDGDRLRQVRIRLHPETPSKNKYTSAFADSPSIYPSSAVIRPGKPLIVAEGEFDALLLAQQVPEASVITLGSASARTDLSVLSTMLSAPCWFVALDADQAGDFAAAKFPARAVRVRPPGAFKDWTDSAQAGVNLRRWWSDRLGGIDKPALFTWDELAVLRWGPALVDQDDLDTYAVAERETIQQEAEISNSAR
jgi:DNA primase